MERGALFGIVNDDDDDVRGLESRVRTNKERYVRRRESSCRASQVVACALARAQGGYMNGRAGDVTAVGKW